MLPMRGGILVLHDRQWLTCMKIKHDPELNIVLILWLPDTTDNHEQQRLAGELDEIALDRSDGAKRWNQTNVDVLGCGASGG